MGEQALTRELFSHILESLEERAHHIVWDLRSDRLRLDRVQLKVAIEEAIGRRGDVAMCARKKRPEHRVRGAIAHDTAELFGAA